jgi:hypothetical protein
MLFDRCLFARQRGAAVLKIDPWPYPHRQNRLASAAPKGLANFVEKSSSLATAPGRDGLAFLEGMGCGRSVTLEMFLS